MGAINMPMPIGQQGGAQVEGEPSLLETLLNQLQTTRDNANALRVKAHRTYELLVGEWSVGGQEGAASPSPSGQLQCITMELEDLCSVIQEAKMRLEGVLAALATQKQKQKQ
ncbi:hypothetical protein LCGC14_0389350 [marine sediment metagenome]|uniref:Uncharacterized protein n=1 Tax=marine sediment metagenome TaxID=412755 RepID=A0A0F9W8X5_9ZZZZ